MPSVSIYQTAPFCSWRVVQLAYLTVKLLCILVHLSWTGFRTSTISDAIIEQALSRWPI